MPTHRDAMGKDSDMNHELPEPQTPQLGATHEANVSGVIRVGRDELPAELVQQWLVKHPEGLPPVIGGASGLEDIGRPEQEIRRIRDWRKGWIVQGPDKIKQEIARVKLEMAKGKQPFHPEPFAFQNGQQVRGTLGECLNELRLALMVYEPPVEAALDLRNDENLVEHEIGTYQRYEGTTDSNRPFAKRADGTPIMHKDYWKHLHDVQRNIKESPELRVFREHLRKLEDAYGKEYLEALAVRFRQHELVGLVPDTKDLPLYVPFEKALGSLRLYLPQEMLFDDAELAELHDPEIAEQRRRELEEKFKVAQLGTQREYYSSEFTLKMYRKAWQEWVDAFIMFPRETQDEIVANVLVGGSILGSQFSSFYRKALELQLGRGASRWSEWLKVTEHMQRVGQIKGYIPPDQIFQALGSVPNEVLAFPDFHHSTHELYLPGDKEPRRFQISSRDLIGHLGRLKTLARLGANNAYADKTGFHAVRNGEFAEYLYRHMGFTPDQARKMAFGGAAGPTTMVRDRWTSPTSRLERTHLDDWIGEVALDKLIVAMGWMKYGLFDAEYAPLDTSRREILSMRGLLLPHYRLLYGLGLPPEQFLSMIAVFPSIASLDYKAMLGWVTKRMSEPSIGGPEQAKRRKDIWEKTVELERPSLASTRALARIAQGVGPFNKTGAEYRKAVRQRMEKLPSAYMPALLHPDNWKWRWFENADKDPNQWKYIGNDSYGYTEDQMKQVFAGYDFTEELRASGLSNGELANLQQKNQHLGYEGWKSLLNHATFGLLEWQAMKYTTGDKMHRYRKKQKDAQEAALKFLETSGGAVRTLETTGNLEGQSGVNGDVVGEVPSLIFEPEKKGGITKIGIEHWTMDAGAALGGQTTKIKEILDKTLPNLSEHLDFFPNAAQGAFIEAIWEMFLEGHCAHKLDALVEEIDINPEKLAGGTNWSVKLLKRSDIDGNRIPALLAEGYFFQKLNDTDDDREALLISPLSAPVPKLIRAEDLLKNVEDAAKKAISTEDSDRAQHLLNAVSLMKERQAFCSETLINGRTDFSPAALIIALTSISEEGPVTGATKKAMIASALRFQAKIHPYGKKNLYTGDKSKSNSEEQLTLGLPVFNELRK